LPASFHKPDRTFAADGFVIYAVPRARFESFDSKPPGCSISLPWSQAKHIIRAVLADKKTAHLLEIKRTEPCLLLARQTWQNGNTVTYVAMIHPGDRYQFAGMLRPSAASFSSL
jgi:GntR family histidine utilization transcriptional repressor